MTNPVAMLRTITLDEVRSYEALLLWCPGCAEPWPGANQDERSGGLHMLPVGGDTGGRPTWSFDGNVERPTLSPSILTRLEHARRRVQGELRDVGLFVCHSFLRAGVWEFLTDSTHPLAGKHIPAVPLPDWVVKEQP